MPSGFALGRPVRAGSLQRGRNRSLCVHDGAKTLTDVGDFTKIPNGTGGLEDRLPVLWTHGVANRATHDERIRCRHLHQYRQDPEHAIRRRGRFSKARMPISLSGIPEKRSKTITADKQQSAIDYNVFEGFECHRPATISRLTRGQGVGDRRRHFDVEEGHGKFVARDRLSRRLTSALSHLERAHLATSRCAGSRSKMLGWRMTDTACRCRCR